MKAQLRHARSSRALRATCSCSNPGSSIWTASSAFRRGTGSARRGRCDYRRRTVSCRARAVARPAARRSRERAVRTRVAVPSRGASARCGRGPDRSRPGPRPPPGGRAGAPRADTRPAAERAFARAADARAVPVRPPGGRARDLCRAPPATCGRARDRALEVSQAAGAVDLEPEARARRAWAAQRCRAGAAARRRAGVGPEASIASRGCCCRRRDRRSRGRAASDPRRVVESGGERRAKHGGANRPALDAGGRRRSGRADANERLRRRRCGLDPECRRPDAL